MAAEPFRINYAHIADPLKEVPKAITNHINGDKRDELRSIHMTLPTIVKWTVGVAASTYAGVLHLCGEDDNNPDRRLKTIVCVPPLSRAILENLFNLIFVFDSPEANARWYLASAWLDARQEYLGLVERHGQDPEYQGWLASYAQMVEDMARDAEISVQEAKDTGLIRRWPLPSQMSKGQKTGGLDTTEDPKRRDFLRHLHKWYYGALSADAHLSGLGFARRGGLVFDGAATKDLELRLYQNFFQTLTLFVALLSEVVGQLRLFHDSVRLREVWAHISKWPEAKELFGLRYDEWLPGNPIVLPPDNG